MGINTYTPDSNKIVHKTKVDFVKRIVPERIHIVQYDSVIPVIAVNLYTNGDIQVLPNDPLIDMKVRWSKNGRDFTHKDILGCNQARNIVYFSIDSEMSEQYGVYYPILELVVPVNDTFDRVGSSSMIFEVHQNPIEEGGI